MDTNFSDIKDKYSPCAGSWNGLVWDHPALSKRAGFDNPIRSLLAVLSYNPMTLTALQPLSATSTQNKKNRSVLGKFTVSTPAI